jgi:hypothetical protein
MTMECEDNRRGILLRLGRNIDQRDSLDAIDDPMASLKIVGRSQRTFRLVLGCARVEPLMTTVAAMVRETKDERVNLLIGEVSEWRKDNS